MFISLINTGDFKVQLFFSLVFITVKKTKETERRREKKKQEEKEKKERKEIQTKRKH